MNGVLLVPGTGSWRGWNAQGGWDQDGSPFVRYLLSHGVEVWSRHRPFVWSGRVNGLPNLPVHLPFAPKAHADWQVGGLNLYAYVIPAIPWGVALPAADTHIIAHSHGLQLVLYACAAGLKVETLISVGSPIREDMREIARQARPNIRQWWHLTGGRRDTWQWLGEMFDGHLGVVREAVWKDDAGQVVVKADRQLPHEELNHSDLLCTPEHFHFWEDQGVLGLIRGEAVCY